MQEVERVLPPEGEFATAEVPEGEEDGFHPEEEVFGEESIAHARAREREEGEESVLFLREEGEERAPVAQGHVPERESFFSREVREESAMGVRRGHALGRGRAPDRESFFSRDVGEETAMGVGQGREQARDSFFSREEGEVSAMGDGRGRVPDRESSDRTSMPPAGWAELLVDDKAGIILDLLLNLNDDCRRVIIIGKRSKKCCILCRSNEPPSTSPQSIGKTAPSHMQ
jgi:hypothetical protein